MGKHALTRRPAPDPANDHHPRPTRPPLLPIAAVALTGACVLGAAGVSVAAQSPDRGTGGGAADSLAAGPGAGHAPAGGSRSVRPDTAAGRAAATAAPTPTPGRGEDRASRDLVRTPPAHPSRTSDHPDEQQAERKGASGSDGRSVVATGTCGASYYDTGSVTANGERFDTGGLTAASKTLPFGTRVRVTARGTGRSVVVRINDRGPYVSGRCLDLTPAAFQHVADTGAGVVDVRYEVLGRD